METPTCLTYLKGGAMNISIPKSLKERINEKSGLRAAYEFALEYHNKTGQLRSGTARPYIVHPIAVACILLEWGAPTHVVMAGLLHDTVEDTDATEQQIHLVFGNDIAVIVEGLTDVASKFDGDREQRFKINVRHSANADWRSKWVKMADIFHNTSDLHKQKVFRKAYLKEKWVQLHVIWDERLVDYFAEVKANILRVAEIMNVDLPELATPTLLSD